MSSKRPPASAPLPSLTHPPGPVRTASGEHPAVQEFRRKLDSVAEHVGSKVDDLDNDLKQYLESVKTPRPPPPDEEPPPTKETKP